MQKKMHPLFNARWTGISFFGSSSKIFCIWRRERSFWYMIREKCFLSQMLKNGDVERAFHVEGTAYAEEQMQGREKAQPRSGVPA